MIIEHEWRVAPESFSWHAYQLRRLAGALEELGFPFALTSRNREDFMVFVVVDCTPQEEDGVIARLAAEGLGSSTSVIRLSAYRAMMPDLGNERPWVLFDPGSLLGAPGADSEVPAR